MTYKMQEVFDFLPQEKIKTSELVRGNIVKLWAKWEIVISNHRAADDYNNGCCQRIELLYGATFSDPNLEVPVVKRDLISEDIFKFIDEHLAEQAEMDRLVEEEEREERKRKREYLKACLRELEDD